MQSRDRFRGNPGGRSDGHAERAAWIKHNGCREPHREPTLRNAFHVEIKLGEIRMENRLHRDLGVTGDFNENILVVIDTQLKDTQKKIELVVNKANEVARLYEDKK